MARLLHGNSNPTPTRAIVPTPDGAGCEAAKLLLIRLRCEASPLPVALREFMIELCCNEIRGAE